MSLGDVRFGFQGFIDIDPGEDAQGLDSLKLLTKLLSKTDAVVKRRFLSLVNASRAVETLEAIAELLELGLIPEALEITDQIAPSMAAALEQAFAESGHTIAEILRADTGSLIDFNTTSDRAVNALQASRLRLVAEKGRQQREATL